MTARKRPRFMRRTPAVSARSQAPHRHHGRALTGKYDSKPVNPLIADAFHRTGAVEVWGRGTNRVIAMCKKHGTAAPIFEERSGFLIVTFKAQMVAGGESGTVTVGPPQVTPHVPPQVRAVLEAARQEASAETLQREAGLRDPVHFLRAYLRPLLDKGLLERTIPDKPRSRMQKYRLTAAGERALKKRHGEAK